MVKKKKKSNIYSTTLLKSQFRAARFSLSSASALPWGLCIMTITTIPCVGYIAHHELHRRMHNLSPQRYTHTKKKSPTSQPLHVSNEQTPTVQTVFKGSDRWQELHFIYISTASVLHTHWSRNISKSTYFLTQSTSSKVFPPPPITD